MSAVSTRAEAAALGLVTDSEQALVEALATLRNASARREMRRRVEGDPEGQRLLEAFERLVSAGAWS